MPKGKYERKKPAKVTKAETDMEGQLNERPFVDAPGAGKQIEPAPLPYQHFVVDVFDKGGERKTHHFSACSHPEQVLLNAVAANKGNSVRVYCVEVTRELFSANTDRE